MADYNDSNNNGTSNRGFASMSEDKQHEIASKGGKASARAARVLPVRPTPPVRVAKTVTRTAKQPCGYQRSPPPGSAPRSKVDHAVDHAVQRRETYVLRINPPKYDLVDQVGRQPSWRASPAPTPTISLLEIYRCLSVS